MVIGPANRCCSGPLKLFGDQLKTSPVRDKGRYVDTLGSASRECTRAEYVYIIRSFNTFFLLYAHFCADISLGSTARYSMTYSFNQVDCRLNIIFYYFVPLVAVKVHTC